MKKSELDEAKKKLKDIFTHYAMYGDRLNTTNLKSQKFYKMMADAGLVSGQSGRTSEYRDLNLGEGELPTMSKKRTDLIFCSVNKNKANMTFDSFLQALVKTSEFCYPHL